MPSQVDTTAQRRKKKKMMCGKKKKVVGTKARDLGEKPKQRETNKNERAANDSSVFETV
jgi:hypothetical protein